MAANAVMMTAKHPGSRVHLGSTLCAAASRTESPSACKNPNRVTVTFDKFDLAKNVIVADLGAILSGANVDHNTPNTSPGCMSFPKDADCPAVMSALGLAYDGVAPAGGQKVFQREVSRLWSPEKSRFRRHGRAFVRGRDARRRRSAAAMPWDLPAWVPPPREPVDNPATPAKVELGRHLFYDQRLSANQTMSCATCHEQARAFTDGKKTAVGITGEVSKRNSMALANVAYLPTLTWGNPQIESLEVQALIPIFGEHPVEMGMAGKEALLFERLRTSSRLYQKLFRRRVSRTTRF